MQMPVAVQPCEGALARQAKDTAQLKTLFMLSNLRVAPGKLMDAMAFKTQGDRQRLLHANALFELDLRARWP